jgi:hypothetical protein
VLDEYRDIAALTVDNRRLANRVNIMSQAACPPSGISVWFRVNGATPLHIWSVYFGDPLHTPAHCGAKGSLLAPGVRQVVENGMPVGQLIRSSLSVLAIKTLNRLSRTCGRLP